MLGKSTSEQQAASPVISQVVDIVIGLALARTREFEYAAALDLLGPISSPAYPRYDLCEYIRGGINLCLADQHKNSLQLHQEYTQRAREHLKIACRTVPNYAPYQEMLISAGGNVQEAEGFRIGDPSPPPAPLVVASSSAVHSPSPSSFFARENKLPTEIPSNAATKSAEDPSKPDLKSRSRSKWPSLTGLWEGISKAPANNKPIEMHSLVGEGGADEEENSDSIPHPHGSGNGRLD